MQSDHYLLHFRTIFECLRGSKKASKLGDFRYAAAHGPPRRPRRPPQTLYKSSIGAPRASQRSPGDPHGPQTEAFGVSQGPALVVLDAPPKPICLILKVRGTQKIGESSVHVLCCCSYDSGRRVHSRTENDRKKLARVPSMCFAAFPTIPAARYTTGPSDRDHSTSSSAFILYCQKGVGGMGEATKIRRLPLREERACFFMGVGQVRNLVLILRSFRLSGGSAPAADH